MATLEKIVESLKTMPESAQTDALNYVEYLKSKEGQRGKRLSVDAIFAGICHAWYC